MITKESEADQADVVLLVLGEESYAEWLGDTADLDLCGALGLMGNETAIRKAEKLGKPVIACIVAGRQVLISRYAEVGRGSYVLPARIGGPGRSKRPVREKTLHRKASQPLVRFPGSDRYGGMLAADGIRTECGVSFRNDRGRPPCSRVTVTCTGALVPLVEGGIFTLQNRRRFDTII